MSIRQNMEEKLKAAFSPTVLQLIDDSGQHAGHAGAQGYNDTSHVGITIVSTKFQGMSRIERSRAVHAVIAEEIAKIHAITALRTLTPEEFEKLPKAL